MACACSRAGWRAGWQDLGQAGAADACVDPAGVLRGSGYHALCVCLLSGLIFFFCVRAGVCVC